MVGWLILIPKMRDFMSAVEIRPDLGQASTDFATFSRSYYCICTV